MLHFLPLETSDTAYDDTQGRTDIKTYENRWKELYSLCECTFHQLAAKNVNVNVVVMICCQGNSIFLGQKKKL